MRILLSLVLSLLALHPTATNVVKVPLALRPTVPLVKGDTGLGDEPLLAKRNIADEFVPMETNLKGYPGQGYSFVVGLGTPPQHVDVLIDTGSANFAVAGRKVTGLPTFFSAANSSTYQSLNINVYVPYTLGSWSGILGNDVVTLNFMPVNQRSFRADFTPITKSSQFFITGSTWEGIVGLAYKAIGRPAGTPGLPFFDALVKATKITDKFSTQLCGSSKALLKRKQMAASGNVTQAIINGDKGLRVMEQGSFVIGGVDNSLYSGTMLYSPIRKEWYYELVMTSITINGEEVMDDCKEYNFDKTIIDTGTTDIRFPQRVFNRIKTLLTKAVRYEKIASIIDDGFFAGTKMICVRIGSVTLFDSFPMIVFDMRMDDSRVIRLSLSSQQYIRYVGYNSQLDVDCFKYGIQNSKLGTVLGSVFHEGFYVLYDRVNARIGFATSTCNYNGATNGNSSVTGPFKYGGKGSTMDCAFNQAPQRNMRLIEAISIVLGVLCLLIFIPIIVILARMNRTSPPEIPRPTPNNNDRSHLLK